MEATPNHPAPRFNVRRVASMSGATAVTLIAAAGSYDHMRTLALAAGQPAALTAVLPLSVDGLALVATVALGDGRARRGSAWFALILAAGVSLVANVLAAGPTALDRCVSAWPSVSLIVCVEVIARAGRRVATVEVPTPQPLCAKTSARPRVGAPVATTAALVAALVAERPHVTTAELAAKLGVSTRTARRYRAEATNALA